MKRISPKWWMRVRYGWRTGLAVWLSSLGVFGVVRAAVAAEMAIPTHVVITAGCATILLGVIAAYWRGQMKMLPDSFVAELGSGETYECGPATCEDLRSSCELTRPYYGDHFVGHELAEQWRLVNPTAFECLKNAQGDVCASFGILPLRDSFMDLFVDGRIADLDLQAKDIIPKEEVGNCKRVYISGVIVRDPQKMMGNRRTKVMCWAMLMHFKRMYGFGLQRIIHALAVTKESDRLMRNLGFTLVGEAGNRTVRRDLFQFTLTQDSWNRLLVDVGDCSAICAIRAH